MRELERERVNKICMRKYKKMIRERKIERKEEKGRKRERKRGTLRT